MARKRIPIEIKSAARMHAETAIRTLQAIMLQVKCPASARVAAAVALLDRGFGKPAQSHAGADGEDDIRVTIRNLLEKDDD